MSFAAKHNTKRGEDCMSNWWLLPAVTIISIWIGAGIGIVVAALMAATANGRRGT
jgi:hypothetical protein